MRSVFLDFNVATPHVSGALLHHQLPGDSRLDVVSGYRSHQVDAGAQGQIQEVELDFFLASAMGAAFLFWCAVVLLPVLAIPAGVGYALVNYSGMPGYVMAICLGLGAIPAIWMLPVVMSHMAMPVQYKGWMVWKVIPMCMRNIAPLSFWMLWFLITNIANIGGLVAIGTVYGSDIGSIIKTMESNADIRRQGICSNTKPQYEEKGSASSGAREAARFAASQFQAADRTQHHSERNEYPQWLYVSVQYADNGQFTYYNKASLELVDRLKEYKYKAKEKVDEDADEKPKTPVQHIVDSTVLVLVFCLLGFVGGMLYGSLSQAGTSKGIVTGLLIGSGLACFAVFTNFVKEGFGDSAMWGILNFLFHPISGLIFVSKNWEYRQSLFYQWLISTLVYIPILIGAIAFEVLSLTSGETAVTPEGAQQQMDPSQMMAPGQMMPGQMAPGQTAPGGPAAPPGAPGQVPQAVPGR